VKQSLEIPEAHRVKGSEMISGWQDRIDAAQKQLTYSSNNIPVTRIRYGEEVGDWHADTQPCHDCAVVKGQFHVPGCDVEMCPVCKSQSISCSCVCEDEFLNL